jgi:hypothetical protein
MQHDKATAEEWEMSEQFTSGPWTANKAWSAHPRFGIFKDRNIVVGKAWTEEDAHLIAAAPELYEALADFEASAALIGNTASEVAPFGIAKQGADAWVRCVNNARAALAKARGSQ